MHVKHLSSSLGSLIYDVELGQPLAKSLLADIRKIWLERKVIIIRGQSLSSEQYIAFAQQLGTPDIYPFLKGLKGYPEITPVLKKETEIVKVEDLQFLRHLITKILKLLQNKILY